MSDSDLTYKLSLSRKAIIHKECPGQPFALAIEGQPLKSRPWLSKVNNIAKEQDRLTFFARAAQRLDKVARPMNGCGFTLDNRTDAQVNLDGFPAMPPNSSAHIELFDGKWTMNGSPKLQPKP